MENTIDGFMNTSPLTKYGICKGGAETGTKNKAG
jgi:hypothetical protein